MARKKTASIGTNAVEKTEDEGATTTTSSTKKKTAKKTTKKKTTKKVAKTAAKKTTKKKTTKKAAAKKTTKKKTTKKTAEKAAVQTEDVKSEKTSDSPASPAKTTTSKKTTKKKITRKKTAKKTAQKASPAEKKAPAPAAEETKVEKKSLSEMTIEERIAARELQKQEKRAANNAKPASAPERSEKPAKSDKAAKKTDSSKTAPAKTEKKPAKATEKKKKSEPALGGEKISGGLLALEQRAAAQNSGKAETASPSSKPKDSKPAESARKSEKETERATEKAETDNSEEEKKLSRSARRRRNKRMKQAQERNGSDNDSTPASEERGNTGEAAEKKVFTPITATAILAEKEKEQKHNVRKTTGRNMLMNVVDHGELRVAIAGKNGLEEIYIEKSGGEFVHGNIFKGVVENVEPNLQAAFVNIGAEKNGFLHVRDVIYPFGGYEDILGKPNRQKPAGKRPPINHMLQKGQEVLVQITREQVATKGPSLTTYISLPGRYLVLMPAVKKRGVSKKINNRAERDELRKALEQLDPPNDMGYIIRTAGMGKGKDELQRDLDYLTMLWDAITEHTKNVKGPMPIYQESDLVIRSIRDYFTDSIDTMYIDSEAEFKRAQDFLKLTMPEDLKRAKFYAGDEPLFSHYNVEDEISELFSKSVRLKSGGELIIEQTEAMVTIDVNTGKFVKGKSSHDLVLKINKEAAVEIAKQLRLRDMGGLVMIDFIDMDIEEHRKIIETTFKKAMQADRAKTTILPISPLGIMEMTRQRMRQSLNLSHFDTCKHCGGTGIVKNTATLETEFMRSLRSELKNGRNCKVKMNPDTAIAISNKSRHTLSKLEEEYNNTITIISDPTLRPDKFVINK